MTKKMTEAQRAFLDRMAIEKMKMQTFVDAPLALIGKIACLSIQETFPLTRQELRDALEACRGSTGDQTVDRALKELDGHSS